MDFNLEGEEKFPFDLGRAFPVLTTFLTTRDKLALVATCRLLRDLLYQSQAWHQFSIQDYNCSCWDNYRAWVAKYIEVIQPAHLSLHLLEQQHEQDKELLHLFLKQRHYIRKVELRCETPLLHLAVAHSCPALTSITLHSQVASDELLQTMLKNCPEVSELEINSDSLDFHGTNMVDYLSSSLNRIVLKPYQLDYEALLRYLLQADQLSELEIDMEECAEEILPHILERLPCIRRLRLFHMEKFEDAAPIAKGLTREMVEITLTKGYHLPMDCIVAAVASPNLEQVDLTEAVHLMDSHVTTLAHQAANLRFLNISWCNGVTNQSVKEVVEHCLQLEGLVVNGIKSLNDDAFAEYCLLKPIFNQKLYDEIRFDFKKKVKHSRSSIDDLYDELEPKAQTLLGGSPQEVKTLRNLRHLECNSCNHMSDTILKVIYFSNRMARVINYYGEVLSLYYTSELSDEEYF